MKNGSFLAPLVAMLALVGCAAGTPSQGAAPQSLLERNDTVKNANMRMTAPDQNSARNKVYANLERFGAEVTAERWSDDHGVKFDGSMTLRLPSANFLSMVDWLKETFTVKSMDLTARVATGEPQKGSPAGTPTAPQTGGVAYSTIFLTFGKDMSYGDSLLLGLSNGSDALKTSLQSIVPVLAFLVPYALALWLIIWFIRLIGWVEKRIRAAVRRAPAAPAIAAGTPVAQTGQDQAEAAAMTSEPGKGAPDK